jgi:uncharacterized protein YeaO (DUF488 family)
VLVDRVWPRGLTKAAVHLDEWVKDIAPSTPLRRWYGHRPERFAEFRNRYLTELRDARPAAALDRLRELARTGTVTLLTATRDVEHSQAAVLRALLRDARAGPHQPPQAPGSTRRRANVSGPSHPDTQGARA